MEMILIGPTLILKKKKKKHPLISWQLIEIYNSLKLPKTFAHATVT